MNKNTYTFILITRDIILSVAVAYFFISISTNITNQSHLYLQKYFGSNLNILYGFVLVSIGMVLLKIYYQGYEKVFNKTIKNGYYSSSLFFFVYFIPVLCPVLSIIHENSNTHIVFISACLNILSAISLGWLICKDTQKKNSDDNKIPPDYLNRSQFTEMLCKEMLKLRNERDSNKRTIWLDGQWGEGKSWIVDTLHKNASAKPSIVSIKYEPWLYVYDDKPERIISNFYSKLLDALEEHAPVGELRGDTEKFINAVTGAIQHKLIGGRYFSLDEPDLDEICKYITSFLKRHNLYICLFIDELDRLECRELMVSLRMIRGLNNLKRTVVFISACRSSICTILTQKGIPNNYLEKISQNVYFTPAVEESHLFSLLQNALKKLIRANDETQKQYTDVLNDIFHTGIYEHKSQRAALPNIRRIDVLIGHIKNYIYHKKKSDSVIYSLCPKDVLLLSLIRGINEEVFRILSRSQIGFQNLPLKISSSSEKNFEPLKSSWREILKALKHNNYSEKAFCTYALAAMFPLFKDYLKESESQYSSIILLNNNLSNKRRISSEYFNHYFGTDNNILSLQRCFSVIESLKNGHTYLLDSLEFKQISWLLYKITNDFKTISLEAFDIIASWLIDELQKAKIYTQRSDWQVFTAEPVDYRTFNIEKDKTILQKMIDLAGSNIKKRGFNERSLWFEIIQYANACYWDTNRDRKKEVNEEYAKAICKLILVEFKEKIGFKNLYKLHDDFENNAYDFHYYLNVLNRLEGFYGENTPTVRKEMIASIKDSNEDDSLWILLTCYYSYAVKLQNGKASLDLWNSGEFDASHLKTDQTAELLKDALTEYCETTSGPFRKFYNKYKNHNDNSYGDVDSWLRISLKRVREAIEDNEENESNNS